MSTVEILGTVLGIIVGICIPCMWAYVLFSLPEDNRRRLIEERRRRKHMKDDAPSIERRGG